MLHYNEGWCLSANTVVVTYTGQVDQRVESRMRLLKKMKTVMKEMKKIILSMNAMGWLR